MIIKNLFKKTLTALAVSTVVLSSTSVFAATGVDVSGQVTGKAPVLKSVIAEGKLQVGSTISLPENYAAKAPLTNNVYDGDGDVPLSLWALNELAKNPGNKKHLENAKIEWFLYEDLTDMDTIGTDLKNQTEYQAFVSAGKIIPLPNYTGFTSIKLPPVSLDKRIGFKVSTRTVTGFPIYGEPVYVFNAYINNDGNGNGDGPTDPKKDTKPDGTIDMPTTYLLVQQKNSAGDWETIYDEKVDGANPARIIPNPQGGEELRASIHDEDGTSFDKIYKPALNWTFYANVGDEVDGENITSPIEEIARTNGYNEVNENGELKDYFFLTVQNNNGESNIDARSEQGLRIRIDIDESKIDLTGEGPQPSPFSMIPEAKVE